MRPQKELELIERLLAQRAPPDLSNYAYIAWERGYLTGLLARLAHDDSFVYQAIINEIKRKS